jgi:uncharacterized protein (DUF1800 family)
MLSREHPGPREVVHLLNRAAFGPSFGQVEAVLRQGLSTYIRDQIAAGPDPEVEAKVAELFPDLRHSVTEMMQIYLGTSKFARKDLPTNGVPRMFDDFYTAKMLRCARSKSQLFEVMADFWFNHFNVSRVSVRTAVIAYERDAIRPNVWGNFRDLLFATASHPAMLFFLDNYLNRKDTVVDGKVVPGINENYGRELLELHTVGVDAGYEQRDVVDAARVFTGWTLDYLPKTVQEGTGLFIFKPERHDTGPKRVFGLEFSKGGGREEGEKLIDYLSQHEATARFISTKLARRLVADEPPAGLVKSAAATFLKTKGNLREVVSVILNSDEFWTAPDKPRFKTPLEYVVSALRAIDARGDSAAPGLVDALDAMGMRPYYCTPPTGYADRGSDWLAPTYLHRINFGLSLAAGQVRGTFVNLPGYLKAANGESFDVNDPVRIVDFFNKEIFAGQLSRSTIEAASARRLNESMVDSLLALISSRPHALASTPKGRTLAEKVVGLILASPEMQARA